MATKKKPAAKRKTAQKRQGRRSVLTKDRIAVYLSARRRGGTDQDCARIADIHPGTVRNWRARYEIANPQINDTTGKLRTYADDGHTPTIPQLHAFFAADKKATSEARVDKLATIEQAGKDGKWQAAAWWLERRYPDEYGQRIRQDIHVVTVEEAHKVLEKELAERELKLAELEAQLEAGE